MVYFQSIILLRENCELTALKSNTEWKQWGKDDPLWGVASWSNKQKGGCSEWTDVEFYALGDSDWRDFFWHWQQYGVNKESCLEIGCGAGRITKPMVRSFDRIYAVDVSEDIINYARERVDAENVEFYVIDGLHIPVADCSVRAIFSSHVLQHLDNVDIGFSYFREFYRVLNMGGTIMVHLPLYQFPIEGGKVGYLFQMIWNLYHRLTYIRAEINRRKRAKTMRGTPYPIRSLYAFLNNLGYKNIEFRIFPVKSNGDLHPFVFATK